MVRLRIVALVLATGCGPRIVPPVDGDSDSDSAGATTAEPPGTEDGAESIGSEETGEPPPVLSEVVYLQFEAEDVQRVPRRVQTVALDGTGAQVLGELPPEALQAFFLGLTPQGAAVLASFGTAAGQAVFVGGAAEPGVIDLAGYADTVWLDTAGAGVWTGEAMGIMHRALDGTTSPIDLGAPAVQLSASRRWAWVAEPSPALHDLQGAFGPVPLGTIVRPTDDPACQERVDPGAWATGNATTAIGFPMNDDHALGHRPLNCPECAWLVEDSPFARQLAGWDTCRDRLLGVGGSGVFYSATAPDFDFDVAADGDPMTDTTFGFSPDGRFMVAAGRLGTGAGYIVVDLEMGTSKMQVIADTGAVAVGHVGAAYATVLYITTVEPTYTSHRLTLATGELVNFPHCGDFIPRALDDGRVMACEREGGLGNSFGPLLPGGPLQPIGNDAADVRLVAEPPGCVDTGVLPVITEFCE